MVPGFLYPAIGEMAMPENNETSPNNSGDPEALGDAGKKALQAERARAEAA